MNPPPFYIPVAHRISTLLHTGLSKDTLGVLIALLEAGVSPEALASVVKELRREAATLHQLSSAAAS